MKIESGECLAIVKPIKYGDAGMKQRALLLFWLGAARGLDGPAELSVPLPSSARRLSKADWTWALLLIWLGAARGLDGPAELSLPLPSSARRLSKADWTWLQGTDGEHGRTSDLYLGPFPPYGGVLDRPAQAPEYYRLVHIPKTGGDSFLSDAPAVLPRSAFIAGSETPYRYHRAAGGKTVALLRNPASHVLSQFLECKYDAWARRVTRPTAFPRGRDQHATEGFRKWLAHFALQAESRSRQQSAIKPGAPAAPTNDAGAPNARVGVAGVGAANQSIACSDMFRCYSPWNMQTRYLTDIDACLCPPHNTCPLQFMPDLESAKRNLERVSVLGLVENYTLSLCLLEFDARGVVPGACTDPARFGTRLKHETHQAHGVPPHSVAMLSRSERKLLSRLVRADEELYALARARFERDVRAMVAAAATFGATPPPPDLESPGGRRAARVRDALAARARAHLAAGERGQGALRARAGRHALR
jgi:hypothetical protein